jgi:hypothetical protein
MFNDIVKTAWIEHKFVIKPLQEPQSEAEESKEEADFAKTVFDECTKFIEALRKYELLQEQKINTGTRFRSNMQQEIETMKDQEFDMESSILQTIAKVSAQIEKLEKDLAQNRKLASIIQLEIKAIFVRERAKFEVAQIVAAPINLAALQLKTRQVSVPTSSPGTGNNYEHPLKIDYNNPIEYVYGSYNASYAFRFATRDGEIGVQPLC